MSNLIEIRWHGRGGQGAKTASLLLADAAFNTGKYIQGFPEYGPERMGAPITAYNRISSSPITIHSNIYEPDYVVVVDDSLLDSVDVPLFDKEIEDEIEVIKSKLTGSNKRFVAVKMLEKDEFIKEDVDCSKSIENIETKYDMDTEQIIANGRYEFIEKVKRELAKGKVNDFINDMKNIGITYEQSIKYLQELGGKNNGIIRM